MPQYEQIAKVVTLPEMFEELGSWIATDCHTMIKAGNANIDTDNNPKFKSLVRSWTRGHYDNDVELLHQELLTLISN